MWKMLPIIWYWVGPRQITLEAGTRKNGVLISCALLIGLVKYDFALWVFHLKQDACFPSSVFGLLPFRDLFWLMISIWCDRDDLHLCVLPVTRVRNYKKTKHCPYIWEQPKIYEKLKIGEGGGLSVTLLGQKLGCPELCRLGLEGMSTLIRCQFITNVPRHVMGGDAGEIYSSEGNWNYWYGCQTFWNI